jgi:predicted metal-binding membrane protein
VPAGLFLLGYVAVWTSFSALAAVAQWALHATALLSPRMVSTSPVLGGGLLIAAGVFQWTPLKHACLAHCRSPLSFLSTDWREGWRGAFAMGWKHGAYCTGCCWVLMALLFVAGVMNLWWIAAITLLVLLEKVLPRGLWFGRAAGVSFIVWGGWLIAGAIGIGGRPSASPASKENQAQWSAADRFPYFGGRAKR